MSNAKCDNIIKKNLKRPKPTQAEQHAVLHLTSSALLAAHTNIGLA